jgi:hypothetical protein
LIDDRNPKDPLSSLTHAAGTYPMGCCLPDKILMDHNHLASELFDMLLFRTGRTFGDQATSMTNEDWSCIVWDLLQTGLKKNFKRKNSGYTSKPRMSGDTVQLMDGLSFNHASSNHSFITINEILGSENASNLFDSNDGPPEAPQERLNEEEPESGVSVVCIETNGETQRSGDNFQDSTSIF